MQSDFNITVFFAVLFGLAFVYEMLLAVAPLFQPKPNNVAFFYSLVFLTGTALVFGFIF